MTLEELQTRVEALAKEHPAAEASLMTRDGSCCALGLVALAFGHDLSIPRSEGAYRRIRDDLQDNFGLSRDAAHHIVDQTWGINDSGAWQDVTNSREKALKYLYEELEKVA